MRPDERRKIASAVLVLGAATLLAVPAAAGAQDFYEPPSPLPAGKPGDLIRSEPMTVRDLGGLSTVPGRAWRILYRSTTATGRPTAVSGTVLVPPSAPDGPRPVIGYSVGTRGIADRCAPSRTLATGGEPESDTLRSLLDRGWAVAFTDYPGLGTPGDHPYVVGRSEGYAVLDAIRAARRLTPAGLSSRGRVGLLGYSQGGHSTAWAAQLQPHYAPKLRVAGVAAGATPSDLHEVADHVDGGYGTGLLLYTAVGFDAAYPELDLERFLNARGRAAVDHVRSSCLIPDLNIAPYAFTRSTDYTTTDVRRLPVWHSRIEQSSVGALPPGAPTLLYHATGDELIPFRLSEALRQRWCEMGVNVTLRGVPGVDHTLTGTSLGNPMAIAWLAERFTAGPPPHPAECSSARRGPRCQGRPVSLVGTGEADRIEGTPRPDVILARGGADRVKGRGGPDRICLGGGRDRAAAGRSRDAVRGGPGGDALSGGGGGDRLGGGRGSDALAGGAGSDRLTGGPGKDRLTGGGGRDICIGRTGDRRSCG